MSLHVWGGQMMSETAHVPLQIVRKGHILKRAIESTLP